MEKTEAFYKAVSNLTYHDVKIYNYLQTSIDALIFFMDSPDKIENYALFTGSYQGIPKYEDKGANFYNEIQGFIDSLEERTALFFTSEQFRKEANGRLYHTVLDPYILSLPAGQFTVIECGYRTDPMFYEDVHRWDCDAVRRAYGVEQIDYNDLCAHMQSYFFPLVRSILGLNLSQQVEQGITSFLFYRLCFRKAEYNFTLDILRKVKPRVILYSHGCNPCFMYLLEAANSLGIPAIEIAHGAYVPLPDKPTGINDFYILQSEINTACSVSYGYNRLFCIGKPGFGITQARRLTASNGPIVVMFVSSCEYGLLEFAVNLSNILEPQKYTVVFRLHSGERYSVEYLQDIQENNKNLFLTASSEPIEVALDESDIVVGNRTTVLLEALRYKNIKVITCNLPDEPMPPANREAFIWEKMIESGELIKVSSIQELVKEIETYHRGEFVRESEIYWKYDGDTAFPAFIDLFANKNDKLHVSNEEANLGSVMALYDVDMVPEIDELVASDNGLPVEYVGIESSDDVEELINYIKGSPCEYISVIRPETLRKDDNKRNSQILKKLALLSNNSYLDLTLTAAGGCEDIIKKLRIKNVARYKNIIRTGIYPLNNILDLCVEERVVESDLSECIFRKTSFLRICSCIDIHEFIKQPLSSLPELLDQCRGLSLKASYAEEVHD